MGFWTDYRSMQIGIAQERGDWLQEWIKSAESEGFLVATRSFAEFLGRLGFVSQVLVWLKPHLAPLYAWNAAVAKSTVAQLPDTVVFTLRFISSQLGSESYMLGAALPVSQGRQVFRTDAKCEQGRVVLGGWETRDPPHLARWFSLEVSPSQAPYLFNEKGESQWASTSAELLATLAALHGFGHLSPSPTRKGMVVSLKAGTDNAANEALSRHRSTTKWPLMILHMQLSFCLAKARTVLDLQWRPREENTIADDLTNEVFKAVDPSRRVPLRFEDLPLEIVADLWATKAGFDEARCQVATAALGVVPRRKRRRATDKTPW